MRTLDSSLNAPTVDSGEPVILDIGCGRKKQPGAIGLDRVDLPEVDIVHDLNQFPYPFEDNSFDYVYATHVIEHMDSILEVMEEIYRISKPGAKLRLITPHYSDAISWQDPTHKWHLNSYSFRYFDAEYESSYYTHARFRLLYRRLEMAPLWRLLGIQFLINLDNRFPGFRFMRRFWEQYLCFLLRAKEMDFVFEVLKP